MGAVRYAVSPSEGDYHYVFEIQPNGEGTFFRFFNSQFFLCTAKQVMQ